MHQTAQHFPASIGSRPSSNLKLGAFALVLVLVQVAFLLVLSPARSLPARYLSLNNWDSFHYERIAATGYTLPSSGAITSAEIHGGQANAVFFPGYPTGARLVSVATGLPISWALLVTAQAAAVVFWFYFLLYLTTAGAGRERMLSSAAVIAIHPAAFYLVTGYTESLFLASMMGFIYWSDRYREKRPGSWWIAATHGFVMSATRIVAFAPAAYPFFRSIDAQALRAPIRCVAKRWKEVLLGLAGISGAVLFFVWCHYRFGMWDLYFKLEEIGWGNERRWFAILSPLSYIPHFFFENSWDSLNRLSVTWTALHLFYAAKSENRARWRHWALWAVAFVLFYIPLTGKASAHMDSMLRYTLPVTILLIALQASQRPGRPVLAELGKWKYALALLSLAVQLWCGYRFLRGRWIA